ncbi:MAG: glycerol-3-phosphate dehydrogenase/oxidase [Desulfamplus sp.]|nr:glycerol-3-phosphate dehydrogenase/oxidase [Desulfamplus sp.]
MQMSIDHLSKCWDLVVVGGGITGAGVFREAVRIGLKTLLLEQRDFAWGTSSRSSKMVHGGLRYLKQGQLLLTRTSVVERQRLVREAPGLVEPLEFLTPVYKDQSPGKWIMGAGLTIYSALAGSIQHKFYHKNAFLKRVPSIHSDGLEGGYSFWDAGVDDARLVLRLINDGQQKQGHNSLPNGTALNYTKVKQILRDEQGFVKGVLIEDCFLKKERTIETPVVINASGAWASKLHPCPDSKLHLRPLRGSHLVFPNSLLPINQVISFIHPEDKRPVFIFPWEGATFLGTTDVDHKFSNDFENGFDREPVMSKHEALYLIDGFKWAFPDTNLSIKDSVATIAGIRPVLSSGKRNPSEESREHVVWKDKGLVTVTGGKLTTFRQLAADTLNAAKPFMRIKDRGERDGIDTPIFESDKELILKSPYPNKITRKDWRRLYGRYGKDALNIVENSKIEDLARIGSTNYLWAELPYSAANGQIRSLDDLLMRRVRIGLLLPYGGQEHFKRIKELCQPILGWDDHHFNQEILRYQELWHRAYSVPV